MIEYLIGITLKFKDGTSAAGELKVKTNTPEEARRKAFGIVRNRYPGELDDCAVIFLGATEPEPV